MQGRKINVQNLVQSFNENHITLNLSSLDTGMYLVIANGMTQKLIIE